MLGLNFRHRKTFIKQIYWFLVSTPCRFAKVKDCSVQKCLEFANCLRTEYSAVCKHEEDHKYFICLGMDAKYSAYLTSNNEHPSYQERVNKHCTYLRRCIYEHSTDYILNIFLVLAENN